jgi:hypothetical protein
MENTLAYYDTAKIQPQKFYNTTQAVNNTFDKGTLTEGEGSGMLTSSIRSFVLRKRKI